MSGATPTNNVEPMNGSISARAAWFNASLATFLWAANVLPVKLALREIPGLTTALARVTLAGLVLIAVHLWRGKSFSLRRDELKDFLLLGFFGIAISFAMFTTAMQYTSVAHAVFIGALLPLFVLILACATGQERFTGTKNVGFIVAMAGVVLLAMDKTAIAGADGAVASNWRGDLMALCGVSCFTFFTVRGKKLATRYDSGTVNMYAFGLGAAFCFPLLLWISATRTPQALDPHWNQVSLVAWISLFLSGTLGSALPYFVYYKALRSLKATQVATLHYIQPVVATLLGVVFLHERLGPQFTIAAALILLGVFLAERR
ncbi:MAG: hypothetical protein EXQ56_01940 [Acidobacteria bacterium]|nr:hypothetical protein [Acidobacteriota bacterium]